MCDDRAAYSTVVGPRWAVIELLELWSRLETPRRLEVNRPVLIELTDIGRDTADRFMHRESPAIAVSHHQEGAGIQVTAALQAELMTGHYDRGIGPLPQLMWEPGFLFTGAARGVHPLPGRGDNPRQGDDRWNEALRDFRHSALKRSRGFDPRKLSQLVRSVPIIPADQQATGGRVAVLDTGMLDVNGDMIDFINCHKNRPGSVKSDDWHGHGTAVAHVIKAVRGNATIHPIRVLNDKKVGHSYEVLPALIWALFSGLYDLINASLSSLVSGACDSSMGKSIDYLMEYCRANSKTFPILVAAAGNGAGVKSGYPARLRDVIVALALDHNNQPAAYNSVPPQGSITKWAYGGDESDPLGDLTYLHIPNGPTGPEAKLWGTSFATAAVSGAHLP
ncbi:S8/S53 family peptidase [Streptomyces sp. PSKA30]|uniref:S8/S53 family peptidase n=1 Tax=Streptomyces sp. PSKA30 TaxID=2874597 RepID=UPI001CD180D6|nr:S8/S53 family peptidase [Streptomyces sp. PSKA30]MBZ9641576.1 S8/S53 family peptidase [Streptomyces sp. PSKA30]